MGQVQEWSGYMDAEKNKDLVIFDKDGVFMQVVNSDGQAMWAMLVIVCDDQGYPQDSEWIFPVAQGPQPYSECFHIDSVWYNYMMKQNGDISVYFYSGNYDNMWSCECLQDTWTSSICQTSNWARVESPSECWLDLYHGAWRLNRPQERSEDEAYEIGSEYRMDPWDQTLYTKKNFVDYYRGTIEWDMMAPEKRLKRHMIGNIIISNRDYLSENNVNHLLDKIIETFI